MVIPEFLVDNTMPFEKEQFQLRNDKSEILAKKINFILAASKKKEESIIT